MSQQQEQQQQQERSSDGQFQYSDDMYATGYATLPYFQGDNSQYFQPYNYNYYQQVPYGYGVYQQPYVVPDESIPRFYDQSYTHSYRENRRRGKTSVIHENSLTVNSTNHKAISSQPTRLGTTDDGSNTTIEANASPNSADSSYKDSNSQYPNTSGNKKDPSYKHMNSQYRGNRQNYFRGRGKYSNDKGFCFESNELQDTPNNVYRNRNPRAQRSRQRSYQDARSTNIRSRVDGSAPKEIEDHAGQVDLGTKFKDTNRGSSKKVYVRSNRDSKTYTSQDVRSKINGSVKGKAEEEENQRGKRPRHNTHCFISSTNLLGTFD